MLRTAAQRLLHLLGCVLIAVGVLAGVANQQILDGSRLATHVNAIRADPDVARHVGQLVSDQILQASPELVAIRPLIESASTAVVSSPALGPVVRAAIVPLHQALVSGDGGQTILNLADLGALVVVALTTLSPQAEASIPANLDVTLSAIGGQAFTADLIRLAHWVKTISWAAPLVGLALIVAGGLLAGRRRRALGADLARSLWHTTLGLVGLMLVVTVVVELVSTETLTGALTAATWHELDRPIWTATTVLTLVAMLLSVASNRDLHLDHRRLWPQLRALALAPSTPRQHVGRAVLTLLISVALVLAPMATATLALRVVGIGIAVLAVHELITLAISAARRLRPGTFARSARIGERVAVGVGIAALVVLIAWGSRPNSAVVPVAAAAGTACNGHDELCERPYDEVSFPATHNSMSASDGVGWFLGEQPTGVMGQLDDGVRVFLIDSWPGQKTQRPGTIANTEASRAKALEQARKDFGPTVLESAMRLRDSFNLTPSGEVKPYLCHALCELGSTEWLPLMEQVKGWMTAHPREVVTFFIEDEVSPLDTAKVFEQAGLADLVFTPEAGAPWPTLGSMIDSGRRLVVLHEHTVDPAVPWILDGKTWVQDTPYEFHEVKDFTTGDHGCSLFRGEANAPLFLVNHWLSNYTTRVVDARAVNATDVLLNRLDFCREARGRLPNYVAVDNYGEGDLFEVVDAINGL